MRRLPIFVIVAVLCAGCAKTVGGSYGENARRDFETALESYEDGDYADAEAAFREVRRNYPYSSYAALAELREADCLLEQDKNTEAFEAFSRFARVRKSHPEVPYARFKAAEAQYVQIPEEWFFSPPSHERDQRPTRDALSELRRYLLDYPYEDDAPKAEKMEQRALDMLARHELYVAGYYLKRNEPEAAIARARALLKSFGGSVHEPEAMLLLARTQLALKQRQEALATFADLVRRFPASGMARQAERFLHALGS